MSLNPQQQLLAISNLVEQRPVCVAYSGGVDSHVLLHLLAQRPNLFSRLRAIHINHGLQNEADQWADHCLQVAEQLSIELTVVAVDVIETQQLGMEAAARQARYRAIKAHLLPDEVLLTAQHQQDQAETLLLQLLRGAGPAGLAAMKQQTQLYGMTVFRPFLTVPKRDIVDYAKLHQLHWIDDPSNANIQINRNYLRHSVWPLLEARWPGVDKTLSRTARHCDDAASVIAEVAQQDAALCLMDEGQVSIVDLLTLSAARQRNVLRFILEQKGLPLPSTLSLQRILDEMCISADDAQPLVSWPGVVVRRYQQALYCEQQQVETADFTPRVIQGDEVVQLDNSRRLTWKKTVGEGLKTTIVNSGLKLSYRRGGERIRLKGHAHHASLKHLFQQWHIPPWQRSTIPLLFAQQELVAIVGYGYAQDYAAEEGEQALLPQIED